MAFRALKSRGTPHIGHGMDQRRQDTVPAVAGLLGARHVGLDLYLGAAQGRQHDDALSQSQLPPGPVQTVAGGEIPKQNSVRNRGMASA